MPAEDEHAEVKVEHAPTHRMIINSAQGIRKYEPCRAHISIDCRGISTKRTGGENFRLIEFAVISNRRHTAACIIDSSAQHAQAEIISSGTESYIVC